MKISIRTLDEQEGSVVLARAVLNSACIGALPLVASGELGALGEQPIRLRILWGNRGNRGHPLAGPCQ